jgi:hypothetical protein
MGEVKVTYQKVSGVIQDPQSLLGPRPNIINKAGGAINTAKIIVESPSKVVSFVANTTTSIANDEYVQYLLNKTNKTVIILPSDATASMNESLVVAVRPVVREVTSLTNASSNVLREDSPAPLAIEVTAVSLAPAPALTSTLPDIPIRDSEKNSTLLPPSEDMYKPVSPQAPPNDIGNQPPNP